jgi:hypothetical protein
VRAPGGLRKRSDSPLNRDILRALHLRHLLPRAPPRLTSRSVRATLTSAPSAVLAAARRENRQLVVVRALLRGALECLRYAFVRATIARADEQRRDGA